MTFYYSIFEVSSNQSLKTMNILKYLLFLIIALAVAFFAVGFMNPHVNYGSEIQVNKSIQEAWAVSQDASKYPQWLEGFKSMELISGEQGAVGSKYKVIVDPGEGQPNDFEMTETVVSIKEFDHVTLHFASEPMDFEQTITFKEKDGGTNIKSDSKVMGKGLFSRSVFGLLEMLAGNFTAQETKNFNSLKKLIEENTTDYYPVPAAPEMEEVTSE